MPDVFAVPVFLVTFREALETVIIVSVLLAFLKQTLDHDKTLHKRLVRQVNLLQQNPKQRMRVVDDDDVDDPRRSGSAPSWAFF
jgi:high-affinity iron transporter